MPKFDSFITAKNAADALRAIATNIETRPDAKTSYFHFNLTLTTRTQKEIHKAGFKQAKKLAKESGQSYNIAFDNGDIFLVTPQGDITKIEIEQGGDPIESELRDTQQQEKTNDTGNSV